MSGNVTDTSWHSLGTNWQSLDMDSAYERNHYLIDPLDFETLLLELHCNCPELDEKAILKQFEEDLQSRIEEARLVLADNLKGILNKAKKNRKEGYDA